MQIGRWEITPISVHLAPISRSGFALIGQERLGFQNPFLAELMVASVAHFVSGASSTFYGVVLGTEVLARRSRCLARQQNAFFMLYVI